LSDDGRHPVTIAVRPWFKDHFFAGKIVFPAVETMLLLASRVGEVHREIDLRVMEKVRFAKFLAISPACSSLPALIECTVDTNGRVRAKLLSRLRLKTMSRLQEHGEVQFGPVDGTGPADPKIIDPAPLSGEVTRITAEHIYRDLVPFGPNYRTLAETLFLSQHQAWGHLKAPELPGDDPVQKLLGSPFPLDGAFHAACVLGQQVVDFVPFPVGFDRRIVTRPTQAGGSYLTKVVLVARTHDELVFDLGIFNSNGQLYETVAGLRMRDVSGAKTS